MIMGYGFGGPFGWLGMGLGVFVHLAFVALIIMATVWFFRVLFRGGCRNEVRTDALEILKQRYAKGEIAADEFQHMKKNLQ